MSRAAKPGSAARRGVESKWKADRLSTNNEIRPQLAKDVMMESGGQDWIQLGVYGSIWMEAETVLSISMERPSLTAAILRLRKGHANGNVGH